MSSKDLIEDLNHLRIKYGSTNVYKSLMKLMRDEYEELSSLFGVSSNNMPTATFFSTSPQDYYSEFMKASAEAAHDTLQEYHPVQQFFDLEAESINDDELSIAPEDNIDDLELINQIFNDIPYSEIPTESPTGEDADTPENPPSLKIIQTNIGSADAPEPSTKKKILKKKAQSTESVSVVKEETAPAPIKKKKSTPH
jgi:hypothetical protein